MLLASQDLLRVEARAVGVLLRAARVPALVITAEDRIAVARVGFLSRSGASGTAAAPVVRVQTPGSKRERPAQAAAAAAFVAAACAALALARRVPPFVKGATMIGGLVWVGTLAYSAWWSTLPPIDIASALVDWRTSALAPMIVVALLFAYDLYPLAGSFVLKTLWFAVAAAAVAGFSTVRLAMVIAGYAAYGTNAFLALHQVAGVFWDVLPGVAVLALAHASLVLPTAAEVLPLGRRSRG